MLASGGPLERPTAQRERIEKMPQCERCEQLATVELHQPGYDTENLCRPCSAAVVMDRALSAELAKPGVTFERAHAVAHDAAKRHLAMLGVSA